MSKSHPELRLADVVEAMYGPHCKECHEHRTTNPSKICGHCLGLRACTKCNGKGQRDDREGFPTGCGKCQGTGVRRIVRTP